MASDETSNVSSSHHPLSSLTNLTNLTNQPPSYSETIDRDRHSTIDRDRHSTIALLLESLHNPRQALDLNCTAERRCLNTIADSRVPNQSNQHVNKIRVNVSLVKKKQFLRDQIFRTKLLHIIVVAINLFIFWFLVTLTSLLT